MRLDLLRDVHLEAEGLLYVEDKRPAVARVHAHLDCQVPQDILPEAAGFGAAVEAVRCRIGGKSYGRFRHWHPVLTRYSAAPISSRFGHVYSRSPENSGAISAHCTPVKALGYDCLRFACVFMWDGIDHTPFCEFSFYV